jgi:hypothetical protein
MSFLDNLENNLKALESREDRDPRTLERERSAREAERDRVRRTAPHAEALRNGSYAGELITACRAIGHARRILVRPTWVDSVLRLEAGNQKLELRPTPEGVQAVFITAGSEERTEPVDLSEPPSTLANKWLRGDTAQADR